MSGEWLDSKLHKPPFNTPVWGWFRNREVEIVQTALTEKEYADYFSYSESSWYSMESEKTGTVAFWMPMDRPKYPKKG
jgi:hypothetical protein